jgi:hypothetical protein
VPSQYFFPQFPVPGQLVRAVEVVLHCPGVCLHDWQSPSHLSLQQKPSTQYPLGHSTLPPQASPTFLTDWHEPSTQYPEEQS